jgi:hypothetical protein
MAINTTYLMGVSLMAMVPLRECKIPTLMGSAAQALPSG